MVSSHFSIGLPLGLTSLTFVTTLSVDSSFLLTAWLNMVMYCIYIMFGSNKEHSSSSSSSLPNHRSVFVLIT